MKIEKSTSTLRRVAAEQLTIVPADLKHKHAQMSAALFPFMRATYYRWAQIWPEVCGDLAAAPVVLAVGDLHVENFGTWRDSEGRLIWGINDFDETWRLPYTHDLVRLAASAHLAISENHLALDLKDSGARHPGGLCGVASRGGRPFVLAEHHALLRDMAVHRLKEVCGFWEKLEKCQPIKGKTPGWGGQGHCAHAAGSQAAAAACAPRGRTGQPGPPALRGPGAMACRLTSRAKPRPWRLRRAGGPRSQGVLAASFTRRSWIPRCDAATPT